MNSTAKGEGGLLASFRYSVQTAWGVTLLKFLASVPLHELPVVRVSLLWRCSMAGEGERLRTA